MPLVPACLSRNGTGSNASSVSGNPRLESGWWAKARATAAMLPRRSSRRLRVGCIFMGVPLFSASRQGGAGALDEGVVGVAGAAQIKHARRQEPIPPRGFEMMKVLQDGGAELVVVRIAALEEDEPACGVGDRPGIGMVLQQGQDA